MRTSPTKNSQPLPRNAAEVRAARWYRRRLWRVLDHNRWLGGAELDLVVRRGRVLAFVEVKSKSGDGYGDPFEMVTPVKIARIRRAAELWLRLHPELNGLDVRCDVIAERAGRIEHLPNAF
ncbi:MAG: YraN family protein [Gaiellaceae bacterium]